MTSMARRDAGLDYIYLSRFKDWSTRSSVRSKPLRSLDRDELGTQLFFSPELVPVATHPLVLERGPSATRRVLIYHLYTHLDFTDTLENEVVVPASYALSRQQTGLRFPREMLADARKIAVDEMHHALFATELVRDIETVSRVAAPELGRPSFLRELDAIQARTAPELRELVLFFFAVISETLITGTLSRVPADERVVPTIRRILHDHAEDEARHHAYFAAALEVAWPQLKAAKKVIGPMLPGLIKMFLAPDRLAIQSWLFALGFSARETEQVIEDAHSDRTVNIEARAGAEITLRHLRRIGVFEDARTADAFAEAGLGC
jgi:hypothetical protein